LFEHQAGRTGHLAVVFENQQLTYAQVNARAINSPTTCKTLVPKQLWHCALSAPWK